MKYLAKLDMKHDTTLILDALCLLCDCLEYGSDDLFNAIQGQATPKMLEVITKLGQENKDYIQTCIFSLGCIAYRMPAGQWSHLQEVMQMTANILGNHKMFTNERGEIHTCVDNALSCLGKCIYKHGASIDADPIKAFLAKLPLVIDEEEARVVHSEFFRQV